MEKINTVPKSKWYAVYVRSRAEKKALEEIQSKGIESFLPLHRKLRQWSDRKKWVEMPLISGYLFVKISRKEYDTVLQSNYIVSYVRFEGSAAIIPDSQIDYLKLMLQHDNLDIEVTKEHLEPGQIIEVIAGPLIGLQGKMIRINGKNKVAIELTQLGYSALIEIRTDDIRIMENQLVQI